MSPRQDRPILIVEDNDEDFEATAWVLRKSTFPIPLVRCNDGEEALRYLQRLEAGVSSVPAIVLLDLKLPQTDGLQILKQIKTSVLLGSVPVIIVTASAKTLDVDTCYRLGANSYVVKPANMTKLREMVEGLIGYWFHIVRLPRPGGRYEI